MQPSATRSRRAAGHYRWIRQLHLWIGAWGALAAILYGATGLVMNHRFGDNAWPQGESRGAGAATLAIPAQARATPEALSLWLRDRHRLEATLIRRGEAGGRGGATGGDAPTWRLSGGNARASWSLAYAPGTATATLERSRQTPLAAFNRLHKGVGGGAWWILLADSFAIGMLLLGLSGLWMWARGRGMREMAFSVMGLSTLAFAAVLALALL
jgi:hypothetical protein